MPKRPEKQPLVVLDHGLTLKFQRLATLCRMVQGCRACPRMEGRRRVLSFRNGKPGVPVMFVAEAPGRNGADRTGVPLHGDPSGAMFDRLLASVAWTREDVFVTNAVLCNPRDDAGNNSAPTQLELENCSHHLQLQVDYVGPKVVVAVGGSALNALNLIEPHNLTLSGSVGKANDWYGRKLFVVYHPSPRAISSRSLNAQESDFKALANVVELLGS